MNWYVYIILCTDDSLYTGISNDVVKRFNQHANQQGAKFFRGRKPKALVYVESGHDRSSAGKREAEIKRLKRFDKMQLINSEMNDVVLVDASNLQTG